jgi:hypothetical protein
MGIYCYSKNGEIATKEAFGDCQLLLNGKYHPMFQEPANNVAIAAFS